MTDQHPITPPPELYKQWEGMPRSLAFEAAYRAGADQELEACCEWLSVPCPSYARELRNERRPKPPSLAEEALDELAATERCYPADYSTIRRALERLQELENNGCGLILPALDRLLEPESNG